MASKPTKTGFTLIEILIVITVLGVLALIGYATIGRNYKQRTYYTRSVAELNAMANATTLYVSKNNEWPDDVVRDVPGAIKEFVQGQEDIEEWPDAPWPGSVYDYENWPPDGNGPVHTYQISVRFCNAGDNAGCKAMAEKYLKDYVSAETIADWDSNSSVYYCIRGSCRSHQSRPINHPGYCINCGNNEQKFF